MDAVILDLDGVVTRTATLHAEAWRRVFDDVLQRHAAATGTPFAPFDPDADYRRFVDGKPREAGARDFLAARGIVLDAGDGAPETTAPRAGTLQEVTDRKNAEFNALLEERDVPLVDGAAVQLRRWRERGVPLALVTSSRNASTILERTGLRRAFDLVVDGVTARELGLRGKPEPDTFLEAARRLGVHPRDAAVLEDATAGVEAARRGGFGRVVGVVDPRSPEAASTAQRLREHGAHVIVGDLRDLDAALEGPGDVRPSPAGARGSAAHDRTQRGRSDR